MSHYTYIIGIDTGTSTGIAVWDCATASFAEIRTVKIHEALTIVRQYEQRGSIYVRVEDARQVRFKTDAVKMKGAGSVCRDAKIWADFLTDCNIPHEMVRPNPRITKWTAEQFATRTGWTGRTSNHARDAGCLVYQFKPSKLPA